MSKVYVLVRRDLPPKWQTVQACHAVLEVGRDFPHRGSPSMVILGVDNKEHLEAWGSFLQQEGINTRMFEESFKNTGNTALATEPLEAGYEHKFAELDLL